MSRYQGRHGDRDGCVLVCGAGAAGMSAALAAARQGARVCLAERESDIGGTVTHALIHTLGGLYDSAGEPVNGGIAAELIERLMRADSAVRRRRMGRTWVLNVAPETYRRVVRDWLEEHDLIELLADSAVAGIGREGDRIVEAELAALCGPMRFRPRSVIDATGTADVVGLIDADLVRDDPLAAAGGFIFNLRNVAPGTVAFPKGVGVVRNLRAAADEGILPLGCSKAWIDTGVYEDEVYVKLFVPLGEGWREPERRGQIVRQALREQAMITQFLRRLPGFGEVVPGRTGHLGVRDGGRIEGEYRLTVEDVRQGRRFEDAACRGCWPIEYWDPIQGVSVEQLPDGVTYDIPMRTLKPRGLRNVWAAGKCLSADRLAQASARVVGTCWAMGEAAGRAAATSRGAAHESVRSLS